MESEWIVSAIGFASRDSMTSVTRIRITLLERELALSVGAYDHPIPPYHMLLACVLSSPRHLFNARVSSASSCKR